MKKLFLVFLFLQSLSLAQLDNTNRWMMRGDNTILSFVSQEDLTNDTLIFVVKASKDITAVRLIEKTSYDSEISIAYSTLSFIYIELEAGDTDDLTLAKYYYDISRINDGDTTTIIIGELYLQPDIGTPFDGTDITGRVTTVSLNNGTTDRELLWWNDSLEYWEPSGITFSAGGSVGNADSLGSVPAAGYLLKSDSLIFATQTDIAGILTSLPDSVIYTSELTPYVDKSSTQTITGQKDFTGVVKFGSDTLSSLRRNLITLGKHHPTLSSQGFTINPYYGNASNWNWTTYEDTTVNGYNDTIPVWAVFNLGYNWDNANTGDVRASLVMENNYWLNNSSPSDPRVYDTEIYFAWTDTNDIANQIRPLTFNITRGTGNTQAGIAAEQFYITDKTRKNFIQIIPHLNEFNLRDTVIISHLVNNTGWLKQVGNANIEAAGIQLPFVTDSNRIAIGTDGYARGIDIGVPLKFKDVPIVYQEPTNGSNEVGIYNIGGNLYVRDGFNFVKQISGNYLPTDTSGLSINDIYGDINTGQVKFLIPLNLCSNGDFNSWFSGIPSDWTSDTPDTTNFWFENDGNKLHLIQNTGNGTTIYSDVQQVSGITYGYEFTVSQIVDSVRVFIGQGNTLITGTGTYSGKSISNSINPLCTILASYGNCEITIDDIRIWDVDGGVGTVYEPHQTPITINGVTVTDTVFIGRMETGAIFDSIRVFDIQDSIAIQLFYRNPTDNDLITTVDTLTADTTIAFDTTTIPAGAKVYMYPVYVGDSEAYLRSEIYWRKK